MLGCYGQHGYSFQCDVFNPNEFHHLCHSSTGVWIEFDAIGPERLSFTRFISRRVEGDRRKWEEAGGEGEGRRNDNQ